MDSTNSKNKEEGRESRRGDDTNSKNIGGGNRENEEGWWSDRSRCSSEGSGVSKRRRITPSGSVTEEERALNALKIKIGNDSKKSGQARKGSCK